MNNKVVLKIVVICAAVFLVFGILAAIFAIGSYANSDNNDRYLSFGRGEPFEYHKDETIDLDGVTQINVDTVSTDVVFYQSDSQLEVTLDCKGYSKAETITLKVDSVGSTVNVEVKYPKTFWGSINITSSMLQIGIPADYDKNIHINGVSSKITVNSPLDNSFGEFEADTVSGDIDINCNSIETLDFCTTSGRLTVKNTTVGNVRADTTSGDIEIYDIGSDANMVDIDTVSGRIDLRYNELCTTKIDSTSGDVNLNLPEGTMIDLDYDSVSGDIRGNYNSNSDGVLVQIDTVSGDLNID